MLFMLQFQNITKMVEAEVQPKLSEPLRMQKAAHYCNSLNLCTYTLPETPLHSGKYNHKKTMMMCPNRPRSG